MLSNAMSTMVSAESFPNNATSRIGELAPPTSEVTRLKVLLVEDDEANAYLIRRVLAKNYWVGEIVLAADGIEALELFDRGLVSPDLAIVDLHLPYRDGLAVMKDFATRGAAQFPFIVLTSSKASKD